MPLPVRYDFQNHSKGEQRYGNFFSKYRYSRSVNAVKLIDRIGTRKLSITARPIRSILFSTFYQLHVFAILPLYPSKDFIGQEVDRSPLKSGPGAMAGPDKGNKKIGIERSSEEMPNLNAFWKLSVVPFSFPH